MIVNFNSLFRIDNEEVIDFETFRKDILPQIMYSGNNRYIFRGQSNAKYELLPSVLRKNNNDLKDIWGYDFDNEKAFIANEAKVIFDFYRNCNYQGLLLENTPKVIKENITRQRIYLIEDILKDRDIWILNEFREVAALAQHYGIPTRLLDWTCFFYVALYFATKDLLGIKEEQVFSIWVMNYNLLSDFRAFLERRGEELNKNGYNCDTFFPLTFIIPEYAKNPNLNAQKGVLSLWEIKLENLYKEENKDVDNKIKKLIPINTIPLDKQLFEFIKENFMAFNEFIRIQQQDYPDNYDISKLFLLKRYDFSSKDCDKIMEYLSFHGVDASSIFPGYSGVVEKMKMAYKYYIPF